MTDLLTLRFLCESSAIIACYDEAISEYNIQCKEIELAQLQNSILTESVECLYEDAENTMNASQDGAIKKFFASIANFIKGIVSKITGVIREKKADETIKDITDTIKENPEIASESIELIDVDALTKSQKKHYAEITAILSKQRNGQPFSDDDIKKLTKFGNDDYVKLTSKRVVIPISAAIATISTALIYCKSTGKSLTDVADNCKTFINNKHNEHVEHQKNDLTKKMEYSKDALANIGQNRSKLLSTVLKNIDTVNRRISKYERRERNMNDRAENGSNIFVRASGKVGQIRQKGKENGAIVSLFPSRRRLIKSYGEQLEQQTKLKNDIEHKNERERSKEQNHYDKLQRRLDKLSKK